MQIRFNNTHSVGMGDYLCLISFLNDLKEPVELLIDPRWNTYNKLVHFQQVLNLPKTQVKFTCVEGQGDFDCTGWPLKFFSPYYIAKTITALGQTINPCENLDKKTFIGISAYNGSGMWMDDNRNTFELSHGEPINKGYSTSWPSCRYHPLSYWGDVYKFLQTKNYDVIDLDGLGLNFEEKVYFMAKHCKAVIGYEGGITHLAHVLNIPCFVMDWDLPSPSTDLGKLHVEIVHQSKRVHIIRPEDNLLNWTSAQFNKTINDLWNDNGNNRIVNNDVRITFPKGIKNHLVATENGEEILKTSGSIFTESLVRLLPNTHGWQSGPMHRIANP